MVGATPIACRGKPSKRAIRRAAAAEVQLYSIQGAIMIRTMLAATAMGNPDLSTLVDAVKAAGLAETLGSEGPFTVFAPTNAAFEALPAGTLQALLKPENKDKLTQILTYHVIKGDEVTSSEITG